jgi:V-type H+-transporting ATPase proteolipid subunit
VFLGETDASAYFFGYMGIASGLVFANLGAAYGTAKSGVGIASLGVIDSNKVYKALIPIIMAGILGIYGIIVSVLLVSKVKNMPESKDTDTAAQQAATALARGKQGYQFLAAGLACGLSSLASGLAIGVAGDAGVRAYAQTDGIFVGMILILIFAECIGLYGMIVAIIMMQ